MRVSNELQYFINNPVNYSFNLNSLYNKTDLHELFLFPVTLLNPGLSRAVAGNTLFKPPLIRLDS